MNVARGKKWLAADERQVATKRKGAQRSTSSGFNTHLSDLDRQEMASESTQLTSIRRFHAWQSALLFSFLFFVHLLFSWSRFMSWVIFLGDLGLIAYLTMRAYVDGMFCLLFLLYHIRLHMSRLVIERDDLEIGRAHV